MLSRASSDAGARLRRAKSSSSVQHRPQVSRTESIDPFVARHQAVAAAAVAYEKAHAFQQADVAHHQKVGLARKKSNVSRNAEGSHFASRHSSVRYSADNKPKRSNSEKKQAPYVDSRREGQEKEQTPASSKHLSRSEASSLPGSHYRLNPDAYTTPTPAAKPSIRRARSMFVENKRPGRTAEDLHCIQEYEVSSHAAEKHDVKKDARNSARPRSNHDTNIIPTQMSIQERDEVIARARDKYLQDVQKQRLRNKPSFIMSTFKKRQERALVAESTPVTYNNISMSSNRLTEGFELPMDKADKSRSISHAVKKQIKRVFRKSSKPLTGLPIQQVNASRAHFSDPIMIEPDSSELHTPGVVSSGRVLSQTPSLGPTPSSVNPKSRGSSGAHSDTVFTDGKSRVTSWADSTLTGTVSSQTSKRLSVINEDGHRRVSSSSSSKRNFLAARGPFRMPMRKKSGGKELERVDSQRLYSALVKRFDDAPLLDQEQSSDTTAKVVNSPQSEGASSVIVRDELTGLTLNEPTIRTVDPELVGPRQISGTRVISESNGSQDQVTKLRHIASLPSVSKMMNNSVGMTAKGLQRAGKATRPTQGQLGQRAEKEKDRWKTNMDEGRSLFYPRSPKSRPGEVNPYELTPAEEIFGENIKPQVADIKTTPPNTHGLLHPPLCTPEPVSPSIYSRHTDGRSPTPKAAGSAAPDGLSSSDVGTAVVIASGESSKYSYKLGSPLRPANLHSIRSSRDWKAWLSKEVAELDIDDPKRYELADQRVLGESGHHRELAQIIDNDDNSIGSGQGFLCSLLPLPPRSSSRLSERNKQSRNRVDGSPETNDTESPDTNNSSRSRKPRKVKRPELKERSSSRMNDRFPMIETGRPKSKGSSQMTRRNTVTAGQDENVTPPNENKKPKGQEKSPGDGEGGRRSITPCGTITARIIPRTLHRPQSLQQISSYARSINCIGQDAEAAPASPTPRRVNHRSSFRPRSELNMHGQYQSSYTQTWVARKPVTGPALDGDTLRMILEGPYGQPRTPGTPRTPSSLRKQTSLANVANGTLERPTSRLSNMTPTSGQRMADLYLSSRRQEEDSSPGSASPAFL
ncbi:hypothetical protein M501DRAFT_989619 [Patellaria atrata CBS 101060]|uniref:Uncharacterized protein n=1 Tax=Patellaria atrata CBS 101060 TaxID=1346257 RepID=A0A9P4S328_9PEZI|nr:hypothetical protein M501DRAFT_989619 [Patellaria atrata CBS 101060]